MKTRVKIEGMSCGHCVMAVKKELSKLDLQKIDVNIGYAEVEYDENRMNEETIRKAVERAGYLVENTEVM